MFLMYIKTLDPEITHKVTKCKSVLKMLSIRRHISDKFSTSLWSGM